jgi:hypothetical protein
MPPRQAEESSASPSSGVMDTFPSPSPSSSSLLNNNNNDIDNNDLHEPLLLNGNDDDGSNDIDNEKNITIQFQCCKKKLIQKSVNHNVFLNLLLSVLYGISNSLWSGTAYIAYIKKLGHNSNKPVGNIEAVSGLASLICALPIGYLADTIGRSVVIRAGGILLFVTAILQISILQYTVDIDVTNPDDDQKDTIALWVSYIRRFNF